MAHDASITNGIESQYRFEVLVLAWLWYLWLWW